MPTCRIAPPCCLRKNRALAITSADPAKTEPTGAPSPFEKQTLTVSKWLAYPASLTPLTAEAFHSRAPSRCNAKPCPRAVLVTDSICSSGQTLPPPRLWVFSMQTRLGGAKWSSLGGSAASSCPAVNCPRRPSSRLTCTPASAAGAPAS